MVEVQTVLGEEVVEQDLTLPQRCPYFPEVDERTSYFVKALLILYLMQSTIVGQHDFQLVFCLLIEDV